MTDIDGWAAGIARPVLDDAVVRDWIGAVHGAMRTATPPGQVLGRVREPGPGWNYYCVPIHVDGDRQVRLLLNVAARLVACASDGSSAGLGPLHFHEVPNPGVFAAAGFRVGSVEEMTAQLRPEDVAVLSPDERSDIAYHRPETVGDVLFNWFD